MDRFKILSNNTLKIIACVSMVFDHLGVYLFHDAMWLRAIGRVAFPIFAFCLAEGCFYTKDRVKHLLVITIFGIIMQIVTYLVANVMYLSIFISFAIAIFLIYLFDDMTKAIEEKKKGLIILSASVFTVLVIGLNFVAHYTQLFDAAYGYYGIMAPVVLYIAKKYLHDTKWCVACEVLLLAIMFVARTLIVHMPIVLFSFISLPLILMYNGKRGKWNLKYAFYLFYPLHIVIIYLIAILIS